MTLLDEDFENKFFKGPKRETVLSITIGTIEIKDNKVVVLAD